MPLGEAFPFLRRGLPSQAFEYILYNKGLMDEEAYPYRAQVLGGL